MHKFLFYNKFIMFLYMFRALCAHLQEFKIVLYSIWYRHTETSELSRNTKIQFYKYEHILTPWCRVLPEQLTGLQLVKKFPAFHGTPRSITALTSVRQLSLSWASSIQSIYPHPTSWRSVLISSTHLRLGLPSGLFPSGFPTKKM